MGDRERQIGAYRGYENPGEPDEMGNTCYWGWCDWWSTTSGVSKSGLEKAFILLLRAFLCHDFMSFEAQHWFSCEIYRAYLTRDRILFINTYLLQKIASSTLYVAKQNLLGIFVTWNEFFEYYLFIYQTPHLFLSMSTWIACFF